MFEPGNALVSLFQVVGSDLYGSVEIISFPWSPSSKGCRGTCVPGSFVLGIRVETPRFSCLRVSASEYQLRLV